MSVTTTEMTGGLASAGFFDPQSTPQQKDASKPDAKAAEMAALLAKIAGQRDRQAFIELFNYYAPRIKSFLMARGLSSSNAEDVLQEAMMAVWQKADSYDPNKAAVNTQEI